MMIKKLIEKLVIWYFFTHNDVHGLIFYDEGLDLGVKIKCERGVVFNEKEAVY